LTFKKDDLAALKGRVQQFVLDNLKNQEFDPASIEIEPPLVRLILEMFDLTATKGEPTGASFQGLVFGFVRADNPHLQVEIEKVRTGSKRLQRVGDVDAWEGARLAISVEAKQFEVKKDDIPDLEGFANQVGRRGAVGIVAALDFEEGVEDRLRGLGLITLDRGRMLQIVSLWDPVKQRNCRCLIDLLRKTY
jgi:hypothetical protein